MEQQEQNEEQAEPAAQEEQTEKRVVKEGTQSVSLKDYLDRQEKEANKKKFSLPKPVQFILSVPFLIIFFFGLFFVPYVVYQIATGTPAEEKTETNVSYSDLKKDK